MNMTKSVQRKIELVNRILNSRYYKISSANTAILFCYVQRQGNDKEVDEFLGLNKKTTATVVHDEIQTYDEKYPNLISAVDNIPKVIQVLKNSNLEITETLGDWDVPIDNLPKGWMCVKADHNKYYLNPKVPYDPFVDVACALRKALEKEGLL